jgi:hypothetical protein
VNETRRVSLRNPWYRMYAEFATDPKVQSMSESMQRRLTMLFCLHCDDALTKLTDEEVAFSLRITALETAKTKQLFADKGFISDGWVLCNWDKRQYRSDVSTGRVKRFRNANKPFQKQHETAPETDTDTDTDTEAEQSADKRAPLPPIPIFRIPPDSLSRIRKLADQAPDPSEFEPGIERAMQAISTSANPAATLTAMEENLPLWWAAQRDGRTKTRILKWMIIDGDYLRKPRGPTPRKSDVVREQISRNPNPRLIHGKL